MKDADLWKARALAIVVLAAIAAAVRLDTGSHVSRALRAGEPISGLLSIRFEGQGRVMPPALYLAVYAPRARELDLVHIPPGTPLCADGREDCRTAADVYGEVYPPSGDIEEASRRAGDAALRLLQTSTAWPSGPDGPAAPHFRLNLRVAESARPAFPREMKKLLLARSRDPLLWPRLAASASRALAENSSEMTLYDAFLLARELARLSPDRVHLSRLLEPRRLGLLLGRVFGRTAGLPEPSGPATVEVLNAAGAPGVALRATKVLRSKGFDVVHFGNARTLEQGVRVVDRAGRAASARELVRILGCPDTDVVSAIEEEPRAAVTVYLGHAYTRCDRL